MRLFQKAKRETNVDETSYMLAVPETRDEVVNFRKLIFDLKSSRMLDLLEDSLEKNDSSSDRLKIRVKIEDCE